MKKYDYVIIGAGPFGATFAYEMTKFGKKCLVIDKRTHIGGNTYTENINNINVHKYGAHIFHTNDKSIWEYVNQFAEFNNYINSPVAIYKEKLYNLPFNMNTFYQFWGVKTPKEAEAYIKAEKEKYYTPKPENLEEQALNLVGKDIYETLIKGYTEKQWGRECKDLPSFIIKRLPLRFNYDNNYFNDRYQGIPKGGYTQITEKMLSGIDVKLDVDFFQNRDYYEKISKKVVFTGMIDQYFDYKHGILEYRSLKFENETLEIKNYQGNAVVNYTDKEIPYTRILEHKHFEFGQQNNTIITKEFPLEWKKGMEPYYPINNDVNNIRYNKYKKDSESIKNVIFGGRLGTYKYYDMHQVYAAALNLVKKEKNPSNE